MNQSHDAAADSPRARGFGGLTPEPLASSRHTFRFILIVIGIAVFGLVQAHQRSSSIAQSHLPLYFSLAALQLLFVWFVHKGIRARGHTLVDLIGRKWHKPSSAAVDVFLAIAFALLLRAGTMLLVHAPDWRSRNRLPAAGGTDRIRSMGPGSGYRRRL